MGPRRKRPYSQSKIGTRMHVGVYGKENPCHFQNIMAPNQSKEDLFDCQQRDLVKEYLVTHCAQPSFSHEEGKSQSASYIQLSRGIFQLILH